MTKGMFTAALLAGAAVLATGPLAGKAAAQEKVLRYGMATKDVGRLEVGAKADITLVSMKGAAWCPRHNEISLLVYSGSAADVDTVLCDGKILMRHRVLQTLDEERILFEASRCAARLTR